MRFRNHKLSILSTIYLVVDLFILGSLILPWVELVYNENVTISACPLTLPFILYNMAQGQDFVMQVDATILLTVYIVLVLNLEALYFLLIENNQVRFGAFSRVSSAIIFSETFSYLLLKTVVDTFFKSNPLFSLLKSFLDAGSKTLNLEIGFYIALFSSLVGIFVHFLYLSRGTRKVRDWAVVKNSLLVPFKDLAFHKKSRGQMREIKVDKSLLSSDLTPLVELYNDEGALSLYALPAVLGRSAREADITISEQSVSRRHCGMYIYDHTVVIEDLFSRYGTVLSGERLNPQTIYRVYSGDTLEIGDLTFRVRINKDEVEKEIRKGHLEDTILPQRRSGLNSKRAEPVVVLDTHTKGKTLQFLDSTMDFRAKKNEIPLVLRGIKEEVIIEKTPFIVGSDSERADYVLNQKGISGEHFRIDRRGNAFFITDLNSVNGVRLNDHYLKAQEPYILSIGDTIILGEEEYELGYRRDRSR